AGLAGAEVGAEGGRAAGAVDRLVELGEVRAQAGHQGVYLLLRGAVLEPLDGVVVGLEEPVVLLDEREEPLDGLLAGDVAAGAALVEEGSEDGEHGGRGRRDGRKVAPRAGPPREKAATRACSPVPASVAEAEGGGEGGVAAVDVGVAGHAAVGVGPRGEVDEVDGDGPLEVHVARAPRPPPDG